MSTPRTAFIALVLLSLATGGVGGEFQVISTLRRLSAADIGKVFVKPDQPSHPNFGDYLVLTSVDSELYGFDTFDWQKGKPIGKLHVSYFALPLFQQVAVDDRTMDAVRAAIQKASEEHDRSLEKFRREMEELRREEATSQAMPPNTSLERTREG
jgi:hypothetical protein